MERQCQARYIHGSFRLRLHLRSILHIHRTICASFLPPVLMFYSRETCSSTSAQTVARNTVQQG
jgi:hypothetical protein